MSESREVEKVLNFEHANILEAVEYYLGGNLDVDKVQELATQIAELFEPYLFTAQEMYEASQSQLQAMTAERDGLKGVIQKIGAKAARAIGFGEYKIRIREIVEIVKAALTDSQKKGG